MKRYFILLALLTGSLWAQNTPTIGVLPDGGGALPPTCRVGQIYFLTTGTVGLYQCTVANTWTAAGGSGTSTSLGIKSAVADFGAVPDGHVSDASVTSGQSIVTCPDCNFSTNCTVGWMMQGGNSTSGQILGTGTITQCTDNTHVTVSTTASATASGTLDFTWGPDNTSALTTAWLATGDKCAFLFLPAGAYFTTTAQFNHSNGCIGGGVIGPTAWIQVSITMTYNFSYTTGGPSGSGCNGGTDNSCFGGVSNMTVAYINVWGEYGGTNPAAAHAILENRGGYFNYAQTAYICSGCANIRGKTISGTEPGDFQGAVVQAGQLGILNTGTTSQLYLSPSLETSNSIGLYISSGSMFSKGSFFTGALDAVRVVGGSLHEENDSFVNGANSVTNTGAHYLKHCYYNNGTTINNNAGGVLYIQDNDFTPMSSTHLVNASGAFVIDQGGNVYPNSTWATNSGTYLGPTIAGKTAITAGAAVLSAGWGNTAAWTSLVGSNSFRGTITASGTGQAANPTITFTFPVAFPVAPSICNAVQTGGTQAQGTFTTTTGPSNTAATFTYSGTPTAAATLFVQVLCQN